MVWKNMLKKKLFRPLKITKYKWQFTPQKVTNTAGSLQLNSLNYAKFGQLYKNQRTWNGKQILSKDDGLQKVCHTKKAISEDEFTDIYFGIKPTN
jgi:hypothetical protein